MDGIVVSGIVRILRRIASFLPVSVCLAYRSDDIILSAGESTYTPVRKELKTRVPILCVQGVWIISRENLYGQAGCIGEDQRRE